MTDQPTLDLIPKFGPLAGFDLETTGPDPTTARAIEAALLVDRTADGTTVLVADRMAHDPPVEVPEGATAVHGITTADLDGAPDARQVLVALHVELERLAADGIPVVIYNASYDLTVLAAELDRYRLGTLPPLTVVDPLVLDRHYDRYRKGSRTLVAAAQHYGVELDDAHAAAADVAASIAVARNLARRYRIPTDRTELHTLQADAHATWARSFADYLRRQGADRDPPSTIWIDPHLLNPEGTP